MTEALLSGAAMRTLELLRRLHPEQDFPAQRCEANETRPGHLAWMLTQAVVFDIEGRIAKANRWLGFVQGVMAADGFATVAELKRANMPDGEVFDGGKV